MRVISGLKRGLKLYNIPESFVSRPTSDRVKESIFDTIRFSLKGIVLDLFSGSGQLGIEALSNGADFCYFCDNNKVSINLTKKNIDKSGYSDRSEIVCSDSHLFLKKISKEKQFDCILLDPPFGNDILIKCLKFIGENDCLTTTGIVVVETSSDIVLSENYSKIRIVNKHIYGAVCIYIYKIVSDSIESVDNR